MLQSCVRYEKKTRVSTKYYSPNKNKVNESWY